MFEGKRADADIAIDKKAISEEEMKMYQTLDAAYKKINQFQVEQGLQQMRINKFLEVQEKARRRTFKVSVIEGACIVVVAIFNVYYLKRVLDNKGRV